jgi:NAD(P)-dependent dehydrogenase (short-subunit alcohol dehydrogenase family)
VNFLGHFMLTNLLIDLLRSKKNSEFPEGRIVNLSSVMHHFGQANVELSATGRYTWWQRVLYSYYSDSKLFMHLFTLQLNSLYNPDATHQAQPPADGQRPVVAVSANPGFVRSDIWRSMWKVRECVLV